MIRVNQSMSAMPGPLAMSQGLGVWDAAVVVARSR